MAEARRALWAQFPNAKLKSLQDEAAPQHLIADIRRATELEERRADEEEARERRKIEAAKRGKEAEEVGGAELLAELQAKKERSEEEQVVDYTQLTDAGQTFAITGDSEQKALVRKELLALQDAASELVKAGLFEVTSSSGLLLVTKKGYEFADRMADFILASHPVKKA